MVIYNRLNKQTIKNMGRKSKAEERKKEILQNLYNVIHKEGLEKATLARIGEEMGVAPSLLTHYFKNKEEMMAGFVDFIFKKEHAEYTPEFKKIKSRKEQLNYLIEKTISLYYSQNVSDNIFYACFYRSFFDENIKSHLQNIYRRQIEVVSKIIKDYIKQKRIKELEHDRIALMIVIFIEGLNFLHVLFGDEIPTETLVKDIKRVVWSTLDSAVQQ